MSNIDKHAVQAVADLKAGYTLGHADVAILNELARIALASLEAEPVAYMHRSGQVVTREECCDDKTFAICCKVETPLYSVRPAPIANIHPLLEFAREYIESWDLGMAGDSSLLASAKQAIADSSAHQPAPVSAPEAEPVAYMWDSNRKDVDAAGYYRPEHKIFAESSVKRYGGKVVALYTAPPAPVVQCPFPCGWNNLNKLAIQDAAFVSLGLVEGEVVTEAYRQAIIANNDRLLKVIASCRDFMIQGGKS